VYLNLIDYLACPVDHHSPLKPEIFRATHDGEIEEGMLHCSNCGRRFPIRESIPCFVGDSDIVSSDLNGARSCQVEEKKIRDVYAHKYDSLIADAVVSAEFFGLTSQLDLRSNDALLDIGCGTGRLTISVAKLAGVTVGSDFSFASLRKFRERIPPACKERVHLVQADAFCLPFRNQIFQRVISNGVFEHLPQLLETRKPALEAARVLSNGGVFVCSIYNYSSFRLLMAWILPKLTYGGGYDREGFHAGKVYFRRYQWREIQELLEQSFDVEHIWGMRIVPKEILKRGGKTVLYLEQALQHLRFSKSIGYYLLAKARKRAHLKENWR
jgi:SAM-dependent methyltransferase/uncharacterized protein YbaR (Trm112 family)